jgi:hypothetical protein
VSTYVATVVWASILAFGVVFWLVGFGFWWRVFQAHVDAAARGQVDLKLTPAVASLALARKLATGLRGLYGRIDTADDRQLCGRVSFQGFVGSGRGGAGALAGGGADLRVLFEPTRDGTRVTWALGRQTRTGVFRALAGVSLLLGLIALGAAAVVMPLLVLPSDNVAIRSQAVQTVQIIHFLWPPFLFTALGHFFRSTLENGVSDVFRNLPWTLDAGQDAAHPQAQGGPQATLDRV